MVRAQKPSQTNQVQRGIVQLNNSGKSRTITNGHLPRIYLTNINGHRSDTSDLLENKEFILAIETVNLLTNKAIQQLR